MSLIIPDVIYVIGGYSGGAAVNTLQSYDMTTQKWTALAPMMEKRRSHVVCIQANRIIIAGDYNGSEYIDTCEAFDRKVCFTPALQCSLQESKRFLFS